VSERTDLLYRLRELASRSDVHRQAEFAARQLIDAGDLVGATAAIDDLELALHPALAAAGGGGSGPVLLRSTTLNTAAILALDTTTVELVPAPAGRRYIWPLALLGHYRFGTTPFTVTPDGAYFWAGWVTDTQRTLGLPAGSFVDQSQDEYRGFNAASLSISSIPFPSGEIEGTPFILFGTGDADATFPSPAWLTDGDGTLTIRTWYSVIDGAP
jgi:hypothetical protein